MPLTKTNVARGFGGRFWGQSVCIAAWVAEGFMENVSSRDTPGRRENCLIDEVKVRSHSMKPGQSERLAFGTYNS